MAVKQRADWSLYSWWILGALLGVGLAMAVLFVLSAAIETVVGDTLVVNGVRRIAEDYLATYLFAPSLGLGLGLVQYAVLRRYLRRMGSWVVATFAAFILLMTVPAILGPLLARLGVTDTALQSLVPATMYLLVGLTLGVAQWLLLRRRVAGAGWWIVANIAGWGFVYPIVGNSWNNLVEIFMLGVVPAAVTAIVLGMLITRSARPAGTADGVSEL